MKSILVFSHIHNSFDKKQLLEQLPNPYVNVVDKTIDDFVKEPNVKHFFLEEIDNSLGTYEPGRPEYKPEVFKQMEELTKQRETMAIQKQQVNQIELIKKYENKLTEQSNMINNLLQENNMMKIKNDYLENKIKEIIQKSILEKSRQI